MFHLGYSLYSFSHFRHTQAKKLLSQAEYVILLRWYKSKLDPLRVYLLACPHRDEKVQSRAPPMDLVWINSCLRL